MKKGINIRAGLAGLAWSGALALVFVLTLSFLFSTTGVLAAEKSDELKLWRHGILTAKFDDVFLFIAIDKGYFKEAGLNVEVMQFEDDNILLKGLIAGQMESGELSGAGVLNAIEKGANLQIAGAFLPVAPHVLYVKKDINKLEDLIGKSMGTSSPGGFLYVLGVSLLESQGIDAKKVNFVNVGGSGSIFRAVVAAKVDSGVSSIEFLPIAERDPNVKVLLVFRDYLPNLIRKSFAVREEVLQKQKPLSEKMVIAYAKGVRYGLKNQAEAIDAAAKLTKVDPKDIKITFDNYIKYRLIDANFYISPEAVKWTQELNVKNKMQQKVLPTEKVATWDIQRKLIAELGQFK